MKYPQYIAVDIDGTIAYFCDGSQGFFSLFKERGVSKEVLQKTYEKVKEQGGFSPQKFLQYLPTFAGKEEAKEEFFLWLKENLQVYEDSIPALKQLQEKGISIILLTVGDKEYQKKKVEMLGIPAKEVLVVSSLAKKTEAVERLAFSGKIPLWVVDDSLEFLNIVQRDFPFPEDLGTIWVNRNKKMQENLSHTHVKNLKEILLYLP